MTKLDDRLSSLRSARVRVRVPAGMLAGLLCVAGLVAMPAVAAAYHKDNVGGFAVRMPDDEQLSALAPGAFVKVNVTPSATTRRHHRVAIVTLARRGDHGTVPTVLASSRLTGGTFLAQVPPARDGTYILRVQVGKRAFTEATFEVGVTDPVTPAPCGDLPDGASAELAVDPSNPRPGSKVNFSLTNTGPGCLTTGYGFVWQASRAGAWVDVPLNLVVTTAVVALQPGNALSDTFTVPADTAPGRYRIVKYFRAAGENDSIDIDVDVVARHR